MYMQFPKDYYRVCENVDGDQNALYQNEAKFLGVDHGAVGNLIAEKWHLGPTLLESISYHHNPSDGSDKNRELVSTVELAHQLSLKLNIGNAGDRFVDHPKIMVSLRELTVAAKMLADIQDTVPCEIERAKFFLEVVRGG